MRNRKGDMPVEEMTIFIAGIIIAMMLAMVFAQQASAEANTNAMTLGRTIDVASLTTENIEIKSSCPSGMVFTIDKNLIQVTKNGLIGDSSGQYYYLNESGASLPSNIEIDCAVYSFIVVEKFIVIDKTTSPSTLTSTLEVRGEL